MPSLRRRLASAGMAAARLAEMPAQALVYLAAGVMSVADLRQETIRAWRRFSSEDGDVFVVKAGPKYELLAKNAIGEVLMATPAVSDGLLIFRGLKNVYAIKAQ